jgi:glycine/D-amino acid oxidase-like deaminating enzyme
MATTDYDYLIVGQGLAGTSLAWHLKESGKKILIVGDSSLPSSSKVAAGIFNPLTGKNWSKPGWRMICFLMPMIFIPALKKS